MPIAHSQIVCVIDDDEAVRDSIQILLESAGVNARSFDSAEAFLASEAASATCIIVDVHMPGIDGIALIALLRARGLAIPSVVMSGRSDPGLEGRARRAGATVLLQKPIDDEELLLVVRSLQPPR
jgi:FixJ family two-component response regulator